MRPRNKDLNGTFGCTVGETLAPLMEGPVPEFGDDDGKNEGSWLNVKFWMKGSKKRSDPRLLLGVLGCPLAPVAVSTDPFPHLSIKDVPIETSSAQYIIHQYVASTGATKLQTSVHNSYMTGKVKMITSHCETASKVSKVPMKSAENGWFVLWQMMPDKWYLELALEGSTVQAGCNGKLVWRHTPWLGAHAAKGPVRPLRRALQGLDPMTTASIFVNARCVGEKKIGEEDCFVLKVSADQTTLNDRSDGPAEIIRHVLFGYFSQKTGWLVFLEDSHLTRIQATGTEAVYWETSIESSLKDYKEVDGVTLAHSGHSVVTLYRFGEDASNHTRTRMEESWSIEEVAFNVPGLSPEVFIPPAEIVVPAGSKEGHTTLNNGRILSSKQV
ncbi:hypothetical protein L7F22_046975 [Adiantum nelumboides]|nr:hypothetical protein [Adiantum nelumboides]